MIKHYITYKVNPPNNANTHLASCYCYYNIIDYTSCAVFYNPTIVLHVLLIPMPSSHYLLNEWLPLIFYPITKWKKWVQWELADRLTGIRCGNYLGVVDLLLLAVNSFPLILVVDVLWGLDGTRNWVLLDSVYSLNPSSDKSTLSVMSVVRRGL